MIVASEAQVAYLVCWHCPPAARGSIDQTRKERKGISLKLKEEALVPSKQEPESKNESNLGARLQRTRMIT
jgi:hypothetical protein